MASSRSACKCPSCCFAALHTIGCQDAVCAAQGRWDGLSLEQMAARCSFTDFHLGQQHGWASVTRMTGRGPVLLVLPENGACRRHGLLLLARPAGVVAACSSCMLEALGMQYRQG